MAETPEAGQAQFRFFIAGRIFDTIHRFLGVCLYLGLGYFAFLSIRELAGKHTDANFLLSYITSNQEAHGWLWVIGKTLPWILVLFFGSWAYVERFLRQKTVDALQGRIKALELRLDPGRTTSMLTSRGETNPQDKSL